MTSTQLVIDKDPGSVATFITDFSDETKSVLLAADTDVSIPVPSDANFAVLYYDTGKDVFVRANEAVIPPVGSTPVSTSGVLLKPSVKVTGFTSLFFRCNEPAFVCVEFYR